MLKRQELPGVLPPYEAVVFDEAHELESTATQYFGVAVTSHQVEDLAHDAEHALRAAGLASEELVARLERLRSGALKLFARLDAGEGRRAFDQRAEFLQANAAIYEQALQAIIHLHSGLEVIEDKPEELHNLLQRLGELRTKLAYLFESDEQGVVYWVERSGRTLKVQASPLEVAPMLRDMLFGALDTAVLTSATLAVEGEFDYVKSRLGLEHARERVIASPYNFERQALFYVPEHLPPPNDPEYFRQALEEIAALVTASSGRAFVLCTSHAQMRLFHAQLERRLPFPLLLQGTAPRHLLLYRFRATPGAVLFATNSFWQGVDVQGEQLRCVIIDRLPFASPGDPVVAARIRSLQAQGKSAFHEFQVPEAVLALKQGFGRLIRSSSDRGVLALLDSRIVSKGYGRQFLASLPGFRRTSQVADVQAFFRTG
ncbi:MAG: ATP-dependent DNA helicase [Terriglobales bacterium]